nr:hypothetical protein [Desulfobacula sp.]
MNHNERVELFDGWAKKYDAAVSPAQIRFPFEGYEEVLDEAVLLSQAVPGMQVLDLGIGTGNLAARFLNEFYWAADETIAACDRVSLEVRYKQVSTCGGVFIFVNKRTG